jgi:hypothetical protein
VKYQLNWQKPSFCIQGDCVEVAQSGDAVYVRDSKLGDESPVLTLTRHEWEAFVKGVKNDEFVL